GRRRAGRSACGGRGSAYPWPSSVAIPARPRQSRFSAVDKLSTGSVPEAFTVYVDAVAPLAVPAPQVERERHRRGGIEPGPVQAVDRLDVAQRGGDRQFAHPALVRLLPHVPDEGATDPLAAPAPGDHDRVHRPGPPVQDQADETDDALV